MGVREPQEREVGIEAKAEFGLRSAPWDLSPQMSVGEQLHEPRQQMAKIVRPAPGQKPVLIEMDQVVEV
jgi:hypothetical protein